MAFFETKRPTSIQLANASVMVAGSLLLLPATSFAAGDHQVGPFRQFKLDNPNMSRRDFKAEFRLQRALDASGKMNTEKQNANNGVKNHEFGQTLQNNKHDNAFHFANQSSQLSDSGHLVKVNQGVDIDLSSADKNITLGEKLFKNTDTVTIEIGGVQKTFSAGSKVTAAEYIACKQMLVLGKQTVNLDASGRAAGGEVDLSALTSHGDRMKVDDLFIPTNLTAFGDVSRQSTFQVTGDLTNAGSLYVYSSGKNGKGIFKADNITNEENGLISSSLSDSMASEHGGSQSTVDLDFTASHTFTNHGVIESSGDLNITAGDVINTSTKAGAPQPVIKASGNLNVLAPHVVNNGLMQSTNANITIDAPIGTDLNVQNQDGTLSALNGAINLRSPGYHDTFNTTLEGGDLLSKTFNVNAGLGTADIKVNQLTGQINESGLASHVEATTESLNLGKICLTGDPTYKNNAGSIALSGDITVGEALTIIASGDIYNTSALTITAGNANKGFPITLIAGAEILSNGTNTSTLPSGNGGVATTISGKASATGGNIILSTLAGGAVTINARGTGANANGGDILMVAYANAANNNGRVTLTGSSTNSGGHGNGVNGNIRIFAGGHGDFNNDISTIQTGTINATGGNGGSGSIYIDCIEPKTTNGDPMSFNADGTINGSTQFVAGSVVQNGATLKVDGNLTASTKIDLVCGAASFDSVLIKSGVTLKTLSPNGTITLKSRFSAKITQESGSLISTTNLVLNTFHGDFGTADKPLITNARYITLDGDTTDTDAFIRSVAPVVSLDATCNNLTVTAVGNIISTPGNGINVNSAHLISTGGSIGLNGNTPLELNVFSAQLEAKGDVYAHNDYNGITSLNGKNSAGGTFSFSVDGKLTNDATFVLTAPKVELKTATTFQTGFAPVINATTSITITSASNITSSVLNTSNMTTPLLVLNSAGSVGTSEMDRLLIGSNIGGVKVFSHDAFILSASSSKKGFNLAGAQTDWFDLVSIGGINITGDVTSSNGNDIIIAAAKGFINVKPSVKVTSHRDLTLEVLDTTATASKSKITIGANAEITTLAAMAGVGHIKLSIGAQGGPIVGSAPAKSFGYAENGGTVYFGAGGFTAKGAVNTMYAKGADIIINNPFKSTNISLGGGVKIIADPPVTNTDVVWIGMHDEAKSAPASASVLNQANSLGLIGETAKVSLMNTQSPMTNSDVLSTRETVSSLAPLTVQSFANHGATDLEDDSVVTTYGAPTAVVKSTFCASNHLRGVIGSNASFSAIDAVAEIRDGHSVFVASHDTELTSSLGKLKLKAGSVVLVSKQNNGLSIYNLHDNRKNSVAVTALGQDYCLAPGQHITIASATTGDFSSINAIEAIRHRNLRSQTHDGGLSIFTSEFSVTSAIDSVSSLKSITTSSHPELKQLKDRMIKTAAVLTYLGGSQADFQTYAHPQVTALNFKP